MTRKREREENQDNDDYGDDGDYMDREENEVEFSFEINEPNFSHDYHGIELYCGMLLNGEKFDLDDLSDLVLGDQENEIPNPLTSVIKVPHVDAFVVKNDEKEDIDWDYDMDMYGVLTLIDFHGAKKLSFYKDVYNHILKHTGNDPVLKKKVEDIMENKSIGLLINHHVYNLPYNVSFPMQSNLIEEYREEVKQKKMPYFDYIVIISKVFVKNEKESKQKKAREPMFLKQEDEYYYQVVDFAYQYQLNWENQFDDTESVMMNDNGHREGIIMFIKTPNLLKATQKMKDLASK